MRRGADFRSLAPAWKRQRYQYGKVSEKFKIQLENETV